MEQVVIENPVINSPFTEPARHFRFTDEGITNEIIEERRISSYFVPIPKPKKKGRQLSLLADTEWTQDRIEENKLVNEIRRKVGLWRRGGYAGVTPVTARLLAYWTAPEREKKLFFCQIEALETAIYITEVAPRFGDQWIGNDLRKANDMLEAVRAHCPEAPFLFTSTNKVYGDTPNRLPLKEQETRFELAAAHPFAARGIDETMAPLSDDFRGRRTPVT